jgi:hypothetical protein
VIFEQIHFNYVIIYDDNFFLPAIVVDSFIWIQLEYFIYSHFKWILKLITIKRAKYWKTEQNWLMTKNSKENKSITMVKSYQFININLKIPKGNKNSLYLISTKIRLPKRQSVLWERASISWILPKKVYCFEHILLNTQKDWRQVLTTY